MEKQPISDLAIIEHFLTPYKNTISKATAQCPGVHCKSNYANWCRVYRCPSPHQFSLYISIKKVKCSMVKKQETKPKTNQTKLAAGAWPAYDICIRLKTINDTEESYLLGKLFKNYKCYKC